MSILNYTTKIDADKTAGEISKMLSLAGASAVMTEYDKDGGHVSSLSFKMNVNGTNIAFKLPCDWNPILRILENDTKIPRRCVTREQAVRVAWRIVKDWVEAQLALIQTQMASTAEVFLPYAITGNGQTLYKTISENPKYLLGN